MYFTEPTGDPDSMLPVAENYCEILKMTETIQKGCLLVKSALYYSRCA